MSSLLRLATCANLVLCTDAAAGPDPFPSLDTNHTSLTMSCGDSLADQVSIAEQANKPAELELGFEQHFRAGSFKGRVELQVVYKTQRGIQLFAGSLLPSAGYEL